MSKAKCLKCNDVIESKHRHDFVRCSCNEIFLDGGDEYLRAGANDLSNILIQSDNDFYAAIDRDEALQKLLAEVDTDGMFCDEGYLDDDFDDYNLGVQAGTLDERERILVIIDKYRNKPDFGYADLISLIKGDAND